MGCQAGCASLVPAFPDSGCDIPTRPGGIDRIVFMKCDEEFLDQTDLAEWQTKITGDIVHATGNVKGSKPKGTTNRKKIASCLPEKVVSGQKQIAWTDSAADNTNFDDYTAYNFVIEEEGNLKFGYVTCDDLFYGWFDDFTTDIDDVRPDTDEEEAYFDGVLFYSSVTMKAPIKIEGLGQTLA